MSFLPRLKKSLGQHFLHDKTICRRIVDLLDAQPDDFVLEIGPGAGALSTLIEVRQPRTFIVIEKDARFAKERNNSHCQAIIADALRIDWTRLPPGCKIIGNLPYNIASPLLWNIVSQTPKPARAVFMVQKEVAQRIAAPPGSRAYGAISVWMQSHARVIPAFSIGPGAFTPPPKVDSAVFSLEFSGIEPPANDRALATLLRLCFQKRRKQMGSIFRSAGLPLELLNGHDPSLRPENLSVRDFIGLASRAKEILSNSF